MLYKEEFKIIELFRLKPFEELTLQEIMKLLGKKSYNWTYLAIQKLSKKGILQTRKIGKTIVAKINLESPKTITELIYAERSQAYEKTPTDLKNTQTIKKITPFFVLLENKKETLVIVDNHYSKRTISEQISETKILSKDEFISLLTAAGDNLAKQMVRDHLILHGAEIYYAMLLEAFRYGIR